MAAINAQMNIRIPVELKAAGDAALASEGFSPTAAVRALWEKAARRGKDLEEVVALLRPQANTATSECDAIIERSQSIVRDCMDELGIDYSKVRQTCTDEELMEEAFFERYAVEGVL